MKKLIVAIIAVVMLSANAFAGDVPEYDTVGCDAQNIFQDCIKELVCTYDKTREGDRVNLYSNFTIENFTTNAGMLFSDPCFNKIRIPDADENPEKDAFSPNAVEYKSAVTDWWNQGTYMWTIVLQKKPQTDLDIRIVDCVLKHNGYELFGDEYMEGAEQTGRYQMPNGQPVFVDSANPSITAVAFAGPFATVDFPAEGLILDARKLPTLERVALESKLYTSKGPWAESIVIAMPETGNTNLSGQREVNLKQGDYIKVTITVPENNSVDLFYGPDNVMIEYIGVFGLDYLSDYKCEENCVSCDQ